MSNSIYENEKHKSLRATVREFAENVIKPVARANDDKEVFMPDLYEKMGELGLFGMNIPEEFGGRNLDALSYIIAVEEIARVDSSPAATLAAHNSLGVFPIYRFGTEKQKQEFLPSLTTGKKLWAFGLTEKNAGSDARGTETTAVIKDDYWLINGRKQYITNGSVSISGGVTLQAVTGNENGKKILSTILVEKDREGYFAERMYGKLMWRAADTSIINFKDVKVPKENLLGEEGKGARNMFETLDGGRLSIAAMGVGLAQGAFEYAFEYSKTRVQFGSPIGKNQAIAFKISEMHMKIELAREYLYKACWLKEMGKPFGKESAIAKLYSSEVAKDVADKAIQIYGGAGLYKDSPVERYFRDQRLLQIGEGTTEILHWVISKKLGL